ncbi:hypothetical protein MMC30_002748 [Trapelia coarctata]|nr:hypothetical protein [Trapelia coarctata]
MSSPSAPHEIVVLGGNFGGVGAAHYLLRHTIPSLQRVYQSRTYHVTLVTPNTHLFFKIGSPRALINSTLIPEAKILRPLTDGFTTYTSSQFSLVQATATSLNPSQRTVTVTPTTNEATAPHDLHYDSLLISTGTTSTSPLWTLHTDQSLTTAALKSMHALLPTVKTVLIAGGGPVGVETAGEIAAAYPACKITLLSGGTSLLGRVKPATGARAEAYLEHTMHVEVLHNVRVVKASEPPAVAASEATNGTTPTSSPTTVTLSDGSSRTVDLYIDATGGAPNSQFLPADWLDASKRVVTHDAYFRVRGSGADDVAGMYVLGDIVAGSNNSAMELDAMVPTVCSSVAVDIAAAAKPAKGKAGGLWAMVFGGKSGATLVQKEYKPMKDTVVVPIGREGGVGQVMGWRMPSWFVRIAKGKSYLVELVEPLLMGDKWK